VTSLQDIRAEEDAIPHATLDNSRNEKRNKGMVGVKALQKVPIKVNKLLSPAHHITTHLSI
jgi:hypothetical protein